MSENCHFYWVFGSSGNTQEKTSHIVVTYYWMGSKDKSSTIMYFLITI